MVPIERQGERAAVSRSDHTQQHGSSDCRMAVLKAKGNRRGARIWALKHAEKEEEEGGTGDGSLALERAGACVFM